MTTHRIAERIATLTAQGFTVARQGRHLRIRCSQCDALVINHVATHEIGCPNFPRRGRCTCDDCVTADAEGCTCGGCRSEEVATDV